MSNVRKIRSIIAKTKENPAYPFHPDCMQVIAALSPYEAETLQLMLRAETKFRKWTELKKQIKERRPELSHPLPKRVSPRKWPQPLNYLPLLNPGQNLAIFLAARPERLIASARKIYTLTPNKTWREMDPDALAAEIFATNRGNLLSPRHVKEMLEAVFMACHTDALPFEWLDAPKNPPDPRDLVLFENGLLDFSKCKFGELDLLESASVMPLTGDYFATATPRYAFDPKAKCDLWIQTIKECLHEDFHKTLQELFGYCMTPDITSEIIGMLIGATRGGKSLLMKILERLIGKNHCMSTTMADFAGRFGAEDALDKRLIVIPDASDAPKYSRSTAIERLKTISGGDRISIDRKNIRQVSKLLSAKIVIVANNHPKFLDASGALAARMVLIIFERSFLGKEDRGRLGKLVKELPGIAVWALEGLHRLRQNGGQFTISERGRKASLELARAQSPVRRFADAHLKITGKMADYERRETLYNAFESWEGREGIKNYEHRNRNDFIDDLVAAFRHRGVCHKAGPIVDPETGKTVKRRRVFGLRFKVRPGTPEQAF